MHKKTSVEKRFISIHPRLAQSREPVRARAFLWEQMGPKMREGPSGKKVNGHCRCGQSQRPEAKIRLSDQHQSGHQSWGPHVKECGELSQMVEPHITDNF